MDKKRIIAIAFVIMMVASGLGVLADYKIPSYMLSNPVSTNPVYNPDSIPTSSPNSVYMNGTYNGYENTGTLKSGTSTLTAVESSTKQSLSFYTDPTWTYSTSTSGFSTTISIGSFQYWSGSSVTIGALAIPIPYYIDLTTDTYNWSLGTAEYALVEGTTTIATSAYSPATSGASSYAPIVELGGLTTVSPPSTGYYSMSLQITMILNTPAPAGQYTMRGYVYTYSGSTTTQSIFTSLNPPPQASVPFMYGWTYSGVSATASWTFLTGTEAFYFNYSAQQSSSSTLAVGDYYSSSDESAIFTFTGSDTINVPSYTISWAVEDVVISDSSTLSSGALTQTPTEGGLGYENQWNSTISYTIQPDSSLINGATVDGKTWSTTVNWNVNHIESVGSSITTQDTIVVSGHKSTTISNPDGAYSSFSDSATVNSATAISYTLVEYLNTIPRWITSNAKWTGANDNCVL